MRYVPAPRQPSLFGEPYRYVIDACSMICQNPASPCSRSAHKGLWEEIDALAASRELITCRQVANEILAGKEDDPARQWIISSGLFVLDEDEFVQRKVAEVVNATPELLRFGTVRKSSSGDAFLIATAIEYELVIITEESKRSPIKIPQVAARFGVESLSISELAECEGRRFDRLSFGAS